MQLFLTKHNIVGRVSVHVCLFEGAGEDLDITTAAVDDLFVFYRELNIQSFSFIAKLVKFSRYSVKSGILIGFQTYKKAA